MLFVGIDIGGTFTDLALYDSDSEELRVHKVRSTPDDPGRALVEGVAELCELADVGMGDIDGVLHGTTVATNAVLEHRGASTGLVTTAGMRDVVHIGRHQRPEPYSIMQDIPWQSRPFVQRQHRIGVAERIAPPAGEAVLELDEEAVREAGRTLREAGVEAVAVCFLFSYLNPAHEERAAAILAEEMPDCFISTSAGISPQFREFERFTTACMNAFVGPRHRPLPAQPGRGARGPRRRGGPARDAQQRRRGQRRGGRRSPGHADAVGPCRRRARRAVGRRPGGPQAADQLRHGRHEHRHRPRHRGGRARGLRARHADRRLPDPRADVRPRRRSAPAAARSPGSTRPGRSWSAPRAPGPNPGPACYGLGGTDPTITDAHLVLGRIDADRFLGGEMSLSVEAAEAAIDRLGRAGRDGPP